VSARVVVIGGGLAGLTAALRLEAAGHRVSLLESAASVGGRLRREVLEGVEFDTLSPLLPARSPELFALVSELGLAATVERSDLDIVTVRRGGRRRSLRLRTPVARGPLAWVRSRRARRLMRWYSDLLEPRTPERGTRFDDRSVEDWSRLYLGRRHSPRRFEPLLQTGFGLESKDTSRLALLLLLDAIGRPELGLALGLARLPGEIAKRLTDVRVRTRVTSIAADGRRVSTDAGDDLEADVVVLATPATEVSQLVPKLWPAEQLFFEAPHPYAPRVELLVAARLGARAVPRLAWVDPRDGGSLAGAVDGTRLADPASETRGVRLIARPERALAALDESDESVADELLDDAELLIPGLRGRVTGKRLLRSRDATPRFDVLRYRGIERVRAEQARHLDERRVVFCGDYLVGPHAEAAVTAGVRAADDVARFTS